MKQLRWLTVALIFFTSIFSCKGGWVISEQISDNFGNTSFQTTFIQQNHIRFEGASAITILQLEKRLITIIFPTIRAYWQGTPQELTLSMIEAYDSQVQTLVLSLPLDQQSEFQSMYDSIKMKMLHADTTHIASGIGLNRTDSLLDIGEHKAREYHIVRDTIVVEKIWITQELKPYEEIDIQQFIRLSNQINPYSHKGITLNTDEYLELLSNGLILKSIKVGPIGDYIITQVNSIKEINIPADFFYPPSNYRKISLAHAFELPMVEPDGSDY